MTGGDSAMNDRWPSILYLEPHPGQFEAWFPISFPVTAMSCSEDGELFNGWESWWRFVDDRP